MDAIESAGIKDATAFKPQFLTKDDLERMLEMRWSDDDREKINARQWDDLPLHLQGFDAVVSTHGERAWIRQGFFIPGNSTVWFHDNAGTIDMGWHRLVKPTGQFVDNGEVLGPADEGFLRPGWNRYCLVVGTTKLALRNQFVPNWGASTGDWDVYWNISNNDSGECVAGFNDNDNNNSGTFTGRVYVQESRIFAMRFANLVATKR